MEQRRTGSEHKAEGSEEAEQVQAGSCSFTRKQSPLDLLLIPSFLFSSPSFLVARYCFTANVASLKAPANRTLNLCFTF